jgi:hypothetical protein
LSNWFSRTIGTTIYYSFDFVAPEWDRNGETLHLTPIHGCMVRRARRWPGKRAGRSQYSWCRIPFSVMAERAEKAAFILTTNLLFSQPAVV